MKEGLDINPDRWPDVSRVFSAAATLDGPSRHAYLDDACRHDPALRAAVESLLGAHDNAGSFGDGPVVPSSTVKRLLPDSQLGPFRVESFLGAGGMGEVYRAHDTKLRRAVAIKVLPDFFAQDANRLARFEEEARALAALNHPHVGAIYGLEESAGIVALVLELVEGPTLAERLAVGPLTFDEVVWIARQLAEGLEAAHERGIVHRDLKPANIKITLDGNVKILDFGLAKTAGAPAGTPWASAVAVHRGATQIGTVLGTVGYMSPEQARGQAVDKRTDIWAFGCVLFEMCAHQPPFAAATISDAQSAVIEREPDWKLLRAGTPANLVRLLRRCLTKDSKLRLRDIGEARIALEQETDTARLAPLLTTRRVVAMTAILATAASFAIAFAIFGSRNSGPALSPSSSRFEVPPLGSGFPIHVAGPFFALSPDGTQLAFAAGAVPGSTEPGLVWIRPVAEPKAQPLVGTERATLVFWSHDGASLAFFVGRELKRINLGDRAVVKICDIGPGFSHGTWGAKGVILLGRTDGASIHAVPEGGGVPVPILPINQSKGEVLVHHPWFLPDGKRFLYTARLDNGEGEVRLAELRPNDGEGKARSVEPEESTRTLIRESSNAQWVDPDLVVFAREGALMVQRVDVEAGRAREAPFQIAARAGHFFMTSFARFSVSRTGSLAYHDGADVDQLVWFDRNGNEVGRIGSPSRYQLNSLRLSQDDSALLFARGRVGLGTFDIWRMDFGRKYEQQLTSGRGNEGSPVWINDRDILFAGDSLGSQARLFRKNASELEEPILPPGNQHRPMGVFRDGHAVIYLERGTTRSWLFQLPLTGRASPTKLDLGQLNPIEMRLSPDERAMIILEGDTRKDVYVSTVPVTSTPQLVVQGLGLGTPVWGRTGREIYYVTFDRVTREYTMMSRTVGPVPRLTLGEPVALFKLPRPAFLQDVSLDGHFVMFVPGARVNSVPISVWTAAITSTRR